MPGRLCPVRPRWGRLQGMIVKELESINLQELYKDAQRIAAVSAMTTARTPLDPCVLKS